MPALEEENARLREALESTLDTLERASRQLTADNKLVLGGRAWGGLVITAAEDALTSTREGLSTEQEGK